MLKDSDLVRLKATATAMRGDVEATIVLVRDGALLSPQTVRLCPLTSRPIVRTTPQGGEVLVWFLVKGPDDMDVLAGDRFVLDGVHYEIVLVRADRRMETTAEAKMLT